MGDGTECGCGPQWRKAKGNGTCSTCGGWLPGEKPAPFFANLGRTVVTVDALTEPPSLRSPLELELCGERLRVPSDGNGAECPIHGRVDPGPAVAPGVHVCRVAR